MTPAEQFMQRALDLARQGEGRTAPNPPVGALLVRSGRVVGEGFHPQAGQPHAEIFALKNAAEQARGADLYVTLEPCCHQGRTGPCTEALITAGVSRVFVGVNDPNPAVAGRGLARLREAGIKVTSGLLADACRALIAPFAKHVTTGRPLVVLKAAMTLDGRTATRTGASQWISSPESRERVHQLRDRVDGVLVGSGTVLADDPRLTTRLATGGRDPVRIVLDGNLVTSPTAQVYAASSPARRLLVTAAEADADRLQGFRDRGVEIIQVVKNGEWLDLGAVMDALGDLDLQHLLLEGGSALNGAMLRAGLVDRVMVFIAPMLLGGNDGYGIFAGHGVARLADAFRLAGLRASQVGPDLLVEGEVMACSPD